MSHLRDLANRISAPHGALPSRDWSAMRPQTAKNMDKLRKRLNERFAEIPDAEDLDEVRRRVLNAHRSGSWPEVERRDLKYAAYCLWWGNEPLALEKGFVKAYLNAIDARASRSLLRPLINTYLNNFAPGERGMTEVSKYLAQKVSSWRWEWAQRQKALSVFNESKGHGIIADSVLNARGQVWPELAKIGFTGTLATGRYMQSVYGVALGIARDALRTKHEEALLDRVLQWSVRDGQFTFPKLRPELADALLLPWENQSPPANIQVKIRGFLIDHFKDPRLHDTNWREVRQVAKQVFLRWLAKQSLEQFLEVVDHVAMEHHWNYRKAFWRAFYRTGAILDAWVVFGPAGANRANGLARARQDPSWKQYGYLEDSSDKNHCILLLKIGDLTVADFSHNGKCRIWRSGNKASPSFYRSRYGRRMLMDYADFDVVHQGSETGNWQGKIASYIRQHTGLTLRTSDYMPKRGW